MPSPSSLNEYMKKQRMRSHRRSSVEGRHPIESPELGYGSGPPPVNIPGALNRGDKFTHRDVEGPYRYRGQPSFTTPAGEEFKLTPMIKQVILDHVMREDWDAVEKMTKIFGYGAVDRVAREFLARANLHDEQDTWFGDGPAPDYLVQGLLQEEAKRRPEEAKGWSQRHYPESWKGVEFNPRYFPKDKRPIGRYWGYPRYGRDGN